MLDQLEKAEADRQAELEYAEDRGKEKGQISFKFSLPKKK